MTVNVTKTAPGTAELTWAPNLDDPRGYIDRAVMSDQLAAALSALGSVPGDFVSVDDMRRVAKAAAQVAGELERRTRTLAVGLRDEHGLSWADLASVLYDDDTKRSTARRAYEAGLRQMGLPPEGPIHLRGCTYENAAHNDRCGCAGLSDDGQPPIPVVRAAVVERARHLPNTED